MQVERPFTRDMAEAWGASNWLRDYMSQLATGFHHGELSRDMALDLAEAEAIWISRRSRVKFRTCITVALRDFTTAVEQLRNADAKAEQSVRRAVSPLFDQRASTEEIEDAAYIAAAGILSDQELGNILNSELAWWRRRVRGKRRFRVR